MSTTTSTSQVHARLSALGYDSNTLESDMITELSGLMPVMDDDKLSKVLTLLKVKKADSESAVKKSNPHVLNPRQQLDLKGSIAETVLARIPAIAPETKAIILKNCNQKQTDYERRTALKDALEQEKVQDYQTIIDKASADHLAAACALGVYDAAVQRVDADLIASLTEAQKARDAYNTALEKAERAYMAALAPCVGHMVQTQQPFLDALEMTATEAVKRARLKDGALDLVAMTKYDTTWHGAKFIVTAKVRGVWITADNLADFLDDVRVLCDIHIAPGRYSWHVDVKDPKSVGYVVVDHAGRIDMTNSGKDSLNFLHGWFTPRFDKPGVDTTTDMSELNKKKHRASIAVYGQARKAAPQLAALFDAIEGCELGIYFQGRGKYATCYCGSETMRTRLRGLLGSIRI